MVALEAELSSAPLLPSLTVSLQATHEAAMTRLKAQLAHAQQQVHTHTLKARTHKEHPHKAHTPAPAHPAAFAVHALVLDPRVLPLTSVVCVCVCVV